MSSAALVLAPEARRASLAPTSTDPFQVEAFLEDLSNVELHLPVIHDAGSPEAASYHVLAHRVSRAPGVGGQSPRVVGVTSAKPRDGATTVAANLALALAEAEGAPTLLVEANRVRPALSLGFNVAPAVCLTDQLRAAATSTLYDWRPIGIGADGSLLHLLAVDTAEPRGGGIPAIAYRHLLAMAAERYHHVVVDCPAISTGGDLASLEDELDGLVVAARAGRTRARDVLAALDQLAPQSFLGTVLVGGGS